MCSVFCFFFHIAGPAFCNDRGGKGRKGDEFVRLMNARGGGEEGREGGREGMVYHTLASS